MLAIHDPTQLTTQSELIVGHIFHKLSWNTCVQREIIGCQKSLAAFFIEFSIVHKIGYNNAI